MSHRHYRNRWRNETAFSHLSFRCIATHSDKFAANFLSKVSSNVLATAQSHTNMRDSPRIPMN